MKRLLLLLSFLVLTQNFVLADEIVNNQGQAIPCKIITVSDGFVEYQKDGCLYKFTRQNNSNLFHDYIDVRTQVKKETGTTRYTGTIVIRDFTGAKIRTEEGLMDIPWWRIKFVSIYKP